MGSGGVDWGMGIEGNALSHRLGADATWRLRRCLATTGFGSPVLVRTSSDISDKLVRRSRTGDVR